MKWIEHRTTLYNHENWIPKKHLLNKLIKLLQEQCLCLSVSNVNAEMLTIDSTHQAHKQNVLEVQKKNKKRKRKEKNKHESALKITL